jgi:hypothetical protein
MTLRSCRNIATGERWRVARPFRPPRSLGGPSFAFVAKGGHSVPSPRIFLADENNRVGYGKWTHIDGWSESVVEYIRTLESTE